MRNILKDARYEKFNFDSRCKAAPSGSGPGWVEGYLSTFGNVDQQGDRIIKGAFAQTIVNRVAKGLCPLMIRHFAHGGDIMEAVGTITKAKEDDYGLWIHADFFGDDETQKTRAKLTAAIDSGLQIGLSAGLGVIRYEPVNEENEGITNTIYELKECKLYEGTLTLRPANEQAGVTNAKSENNLQPIIERLDKIENQLKTFTAKTTTPAGDISNPVETVNTGDADLTAIGLELAKNRIIIERNK